MKYITLFLAAAISLSFVSSATNKSSLHIVVVLSTSESEVESSNISVVNYWKQAKELLPAAELAIYEVNNDSDILNDYVIELLPIFVPDSDPNHGVVEFVKELVSRSRNIVGVVGIFDNRFANVFLPLAGHAGIDLIQLVDPTALNLDNSRMYPHTFTLYPSLAMHVRAASFMFRKLNWIRVGLVYSSTLYDPLYLRAAESFLSLDVHINVALFDVEQNATATSTVGRMQQSGVLAFLTLLPQQASAELIYAAHQQGLEYAWVLVDDGDLNDTLYRCTGYNASVELRKLILIIQQIPNGTFCDGLSALNLGTGDHPRSRVKENPYLSVVYESVLALSRALNASLETLKGRNISLEDFGRRVNHASITEVIEKELLEQELSGMAGIRRYPHTDNTVFNVLQFQSGHYQQVGYFDSQTNNLPLNVTITVSGLGPNITYTYTVFPAALTISLSVATGIAFLFTTVILLAYFFYRNEPEVKSSSFRLSFCMFLGCYLILFSVLCHFVFSGFHSALILDAQLANGLRYSVCSIISYSFSFGCDLLFTTLLAKLIRVWRIFTLHGRTSKFWSDQYMLLFIGLVVLPKIVILVIWTVVDIYRIQDVEMLVSSDGVNSHYMIVEQCYSEYYVMWIFVVYGYSVAIGIAVIAVSIKTRKIKQENFKDTKKVSILISSLMYMALVCGSLWAILRLNGDSIASRVVIGIAFCLVAVLSEVFLFLPKVLPPLQRKFKTAGVAHKSVNTSVMSSRLNSSLYST